MVTILHDAPEAIAANIADAVMTVIAAAGTHQNLNALAPTPMPVSQIAAAQIYRQRRVRDRVFGARADAFGDPAWDILLDLYAASGTRKRICISSACIAANAPTSTALRYLARLLDHGLIKRVPDEADRRRYFVQLTEHGDALMEECMAGISNDTVR
jgi:DNA-binding MarR family transcriptional regulator